MFGFAWLRGNTYKLSVAESIDDGRFTDVWVTYHTYRNEVGLILFFYFDFFMFFLDLSLELLKLILSQDSNDFLE